MKRETSAPAIGAGAEVSLVCRREQLSNSLGNLAEAASNGVALATVAAIQSPIQPATTGMYPPEPSCDPSAAQRPQWSRGARSRPPSA